MKTTTVVSIILLLMSLENSVAKKKSKIVLASQPKVTIFSIEKVLDSFTSFVKEVKEFSELYKDNIEKKTKQIHIYEAMVIKLESNIKELLHNTKIQNETDNNTQLLEQIQKNDKIIKELGSEINVLNSSVTSFESNIQQMNLQILSLTSKSNLDAEIIQNQKELIHSYETHCKASSCEPFGNATTVRIIQVKGVGSLQVLCNGQLAGPGWTVIQRRINGSVNFYRNWTEYQTGFGNLNGEFFIGLEKLHHMTAVEQQELYIHLEDFDGITRYAKYDNFSVGDEQESYVLKSLGTYTGNIIDRLRFNEGQKFSTYDRDNDNDKNLSCAINSNGAWWYNSCGLCNLNGIYKLGDEDYSYGYDGIYWDCDLHEADYSWKSVQIMIRPMKKKRL